jgi:tRNA (guanine-N7-)-methyltransferase
LLSGVLPSAALRLSEPPPADLGALFAPRMEEVWLEIGFGGGEHLLWQARNHPSIGLIGCEPFEDGVVKVLSAIDREGLGNVRLHADDARPLLRWLPAASIGRAFILFPDPWPKKRHRKRRLVSAATLTELARSMRSGSELRLATDVADYAHSILVAVGEVGCFRWLADGPSDWRTRTADWPATRYEGKAVAAGRRCTYLRFRRT